MQILFFLLQAFSNIFGRKLIQTKTEPKVKARALAWPGTDFEELKESENQLEEESDNNASHHSKLNVLHPNSPYGLIHHVITPHQLAHPQNPINHNQRFSDTSPTSNDLNGLNPDDVWLSDGNLLVLKGGVTPYHSIPNEIDDGISDNIDQGETYSIREAGGNANSIVGSGHSFVENSVTYANSGKLAIAPAPPQIVSKYKNNLSSITNSFHSINPDTPQQNSHVRRVPKHIGSNFLQPFVPKNTQVPENFGVQKKIQTTHSNVQPVETSFTPSQRIQTQSVYIPQINKYFHSFKPTYQNPTNAVVHSKMFPFYPATPTWISSTKVLPVTNPPPLNSAGGVSIRARHNRKSYIHSVPPTTLQNTFQQSKPVINPLIAYLKTYSIQKSKTPASFVQFSRDPQQIQKPNINYNHLSHTNSFHNVIQKSPNSNVMSQQYPFNKQYNHHNLKNVHQVLQYQQPKHAKNHVQWERKYLSKLSGRNKGSILDYLRSVRSYIPSLKKH